MPTFQAYVELLKGYPENHKDNGSKLSHLHNETTQSPKLEEQYYCKQKNIEGYLCNSKVTTVVFKSFKLPYFN